MKRDLKLLFCHSERSEESILCRYIEILCFAQNDILKTIAKQCFQNYSLFTFHSSLKTSFPHKSLCLISLLGLAGNKTRNYSVLVLIFALLLLYYYTKKVFLLFLICFLAGLGRCFLSICSVFANTLLPNLRFLNRLQK